MNMSSEMKNQEAQNQGLSDQNLLEIYELKTSALELLFGSQDIELTP